MKLIRLGVIKNIRELPEGNLPKEAVQFKEPANAITLNLFALLATIPVLLLCFGLIRLAVEFKAIYFYPGMTTLIALLGLFLSLIPHELLHAVCLGKDRVAYLIFYKGLLGIYSTEPISKSRFILMSLCPNLVLGWLPFFCWLILPMNSDWSSFFAVFSMGNILFGVGDYINVLNAAIQMPRGSLQQMSGFHSFWYRPDDLTAKQEGEENSSK